MEWDLRIYNEVIEGCRSLLSKGCSSTAMEKGTVPGSTEASFYVPVMFQKLQQAWKETEPERTEPWRQSTTEQEET